MKVKKTQCNNMKLNVSKRYKRERKLQHNSTINEGEENTMSQYEIKCMEEIKERENYNIKWIEKLREREREKPPPRQT